MESIEGLKVDLMGSTVDSMENIGDLMASTAGLMESIVD